jgi:hypothetical protein
MSLVVEIDDCDALDMFYTIGTIIVVPGGWNLMVGNQVCFGEPIATAAEAEEAAISLIRLTLLRITEEAVKHGGLSQDNLDRLSKLN